MDALRQHSFAAQLGVQAEGSQLPTAVALSPKKKSILQLQREYSLANLQDFLRGLLGNALVPRAIEVGRPACLHTSAEQHVHGSQRHRLWTLLSAFAFDICATVQPACPHVLGLLSLSGLYAATANQPLVADVVSKPRTHVCA